MRKIMTLVMAATLVYGASVFTSCVSDNYDNPVMNTLSVTVKEGATVTPKVIVSPTTFTEGQTVTLTAVTGYKFRRAEAGNASVTTQKNGRLLINYSLLTVPVTWGQEDGTYLTADDLPGFKPISAEEAAQWVASESDKENGAYFIYDFDAEGNMLYYATLLGVDPLAAEPGKMPRNNMNYMSNSSNLHLRFYYTSTSTIIGDKKVATFQMPASSVTVDCDMVRDMSVDVTATMSATAFGLKQEGDGFVLTEGEGLTAILPDVYDEIGSPLVSMQDAIDYTLTLQKQGTGDEWTDVKTLSEGTFRWVITGIDYYEGTITTAPFTLAVESDLNLAENIIGKWMVAELDGEPCPTNWKTVLTFVSPTQAYGSLSDYFSLSWNERVLAEVEINGNKVNVVNQDGNTKNVLDCTVLSISDKEMEISSDWTVYVDGESVQHEVYGKERYVRITNDYQDAIIGTWEGKATSEDDEHTDGELHRWEYRADDTFVYYNEASGQWVKNNDVLAQYFVDGILLCTRWKNTTDSEELREWWEIESIKDGVMKWTALRQREDGSTYTATFEMKKVE